ncbi:hypothetical protein WJX72_006124 [[Myrmecia] bisecta]|uniref:Uncharacterized protein n=1 Tax=[Myrmecia] bisecta TaxID=41462 RepID=A0AAW1QQW2_9CHLO
MHRSAEVPHPKRSAGCKWCSITLLLALTALTMVALLEPHLGEDSELTTHSDAREKRWRWEVRLHWQEPQPANQTSSTSYPTAQHLQATQLPTRIYSEAGAFQHIQPSQEFCSVGQLRPFCGDIDKPGGLKQALEARNYHKEIIHFMAAAKQLDAALNLVFNLHALGYNHFLLHADSAATCDLAMAAMPDIGCGWSGALADNIPPAIAKVPPYRTSLLRWHTVARMVRLGYHVLALHTDLAIHEDIYSYFKRAPLDNATLVVQHDGGSPGAHETVVYCQNAAPEGPAAWILAEIPDRMLHWAEHPGLLEDRLPEVGPSDGLLQAAWPQAILNDAVFSATVKRPVAPQSLYPHGQDIERQVNWIDAHGRLSLAANKEVLRTPELPPGWHGRKQASVMAYDMEVPFCEGHWPLEYGAQFLPRERGPSAAAFWLLLENEAGPALMWPDPNDDQDPSHYVRERVTERMAVASGADWLVADWKAKPRAIVSHFASVEGGHAAKVAAAKAHGLWAYQVDDMLRSGNQSTPRAAAAGAAPALKQRAGHPKRLIAYAPGMNLRIQSRRDWQALVLALVQAAILSGRTPVWPALPCDLPWLAPDNNAHSGFAGDPQASAGAAGQPARLEVVAVGNASQDQQCLVWLTYPDACAAQGLLLPDFQHMLNQHLPASSRTSSRVNTALFGPSRWRAFWARVTSPFRAWVGSWLQPLRAFWDLAEREWAWGQMHSARSGRTAAFGEGSTAAESAGQGSGAAVQTSEPQGADVGSVLEETDAASLGLGNQPASGTQASAISDRLGESEAVGEPSGSDIQAAAITDQLDKTIQRQIEGRQTHEAPQIDTPNVAQVVELAPEQALELQRELLSMRRQPVVYLGQAVQINAAELADALPAPLWFFHSLRRMQRTCLKPAFGVSVDWEAHVGATSERP